MNSLVRKLRELSGLTQSEFASELKVSQGAVSLYESGKRSPNLSTFRSSAEALGRRVSLLPKQLEPAWSRSEQFSRLLYLEVAKQFLADHARVRSVAARNLQAMSNNPQIAEYVARWNEVLKEGNEVELLTLLTIPDRENTGLLSSSPFAGVLDQNTRMDLLALARSA